MIRNVVVALALLPMLAGCMSMSRSAPVTAIAPEVAAGARISEIVLKQAPGLKVTPQFDEIFRSHVQAKLDACATGTRPLRLEATIERLDKANPLLTAVVAGSNVLRGSARLVDPATGAVVADYTVGQTVIGGRFAVVVMAEAEEQLSDGFGTELCKQAFATPK